MKKQERLVFQSPRVGKSRPEWLEGNLPPGCNGSEPEGHCYGVRQLLAELEIFQQSAEDCSQREQARSEAPGRYLQ